MGARTPRRRFAAVATASLACLLTLAASAAAITAVKPLKLKPPALKGATATVPYAAQLGASGGTAPYTFAVTVGALPEGLSLSPSGAITGTPTNAESSSFTIEATDSSVPARSGTIHYSLPVQLDVSPKSLRPVSAWTTAVDVALGAAGGSGHYSFSLVEGALPEGVEIYEGTEEFHALSGTAYRAGTYEFAIQATDKNTGVTGVRHYRLEVQPRHLAASGPLPEGAPGEPYRGGFNAEGGSGYTYEIVEGHLPEGLVLGQEENVDHDHRHARQSRKAEVHGPGHRHGNRAVGEGEVQDHDRAVRLPEGRRLTGRKKLRRRIPRPRHGVLRTRRGTWRASRPAGWGTATARPGRGRTRSRPGSSCSTGPKSRAREASRTKARARRRRSAAKGLDPQGVWVLTSLF